MVAKRKKLEQEAEKKRLEEEAQQMAWKTTMKSAMGYIAYGICNGLQCMVFGDISLKNNNLHPCI